MTRIAEKLKFMKASAKQVLKEMRGIKKHVFLPIFNKAASRTKILDSPR
jgi:hypothetical protein